MCCGYYDRLKNGQISLEKFYLKRYSRIWPFFAMLVCLDLLLKRDLHTLYDAIANLTLAFNFLPVPKIDCIGVGWFIGIIFMFYIIFPFFVFLNANKKRALFALLVSILFAVIAKEYYFQSPFVGIYFKEERNMINCAPYFFTGSIIYLYRSRLYKYVNKLLTTTNVIVFVVFVAISFLHHHSNDDIACFLLKIILFAWL